LEHSCPDSGGIFQQKNNEYVHAEQMVAV
jgi:hypothetical protein